ncbi:DUF3108 domain-containing protein [Sphingomonas sp. UYP23]
MIKVLAAVLIAAQLTPQPPRTVVRVGDGLAQTRLLPSGTRRYVRYLVKPDGSRQLLDLWQRRVERAPLPGSARPGLHLTQRWDSVRDNSTLIQDSWFEATTFEPVTHVRRKTKDGQTIVLGYRFSHDKVTGLIDLPDATNPTFRMALSEPSFNFEYDMELFEALPLAAGSIFDIPFYDAGIDKAPQRYRFVVARSEILSGPDRQKIDCWVLTGDYRTGKVLNSFWIAKRSHVLVREEGLGPDGSRLVKALLPPEAGDPS